MKDNSSTENLDVNHPIYGEIKINDTIEWSGDYFSGYDDNGEMLCNNHQSGINKVTKFFNEFNLVWMELDNEKQFIIKNLKHPNKIIDSSWKKL